VFLLPASPAITLPLVATVITSNSVATDRFRYTIYRISLSTCSYYTQTEEFQTGLLVNDRIFA
jgi:hypothetical protein